MIRFAMAIEVAPRAGAWIETINFRSDTGKMLVAPRAGAWIETRPVRGILLSHSRPPRGGVD